VRLEKMGILSWVDDLGGNANGGDGIIIREPWEQEELDGEGMYEVQKKNCSIFLDQIKNF
jgi:hypothetical protein